MVRAGAILLLAITVFFLACGGPHTTPAAGLFLVAKQYLVFAAPLVWRLAHKTADPRRFLTRASMVALALTLPWLIRHPVTFVENVVLLQTREPFRGDALSYISWAARSGWGAGTIVWAVGAAVVGVAVTLVATPATPAGFAAGVGFFCLLTFAFGSKAFANYYFLVIAAFCCAVAAREPRVSRSRCQAHLDRPPDQGAGCLCRSSKCASGFRILRSAAIRESILVYPLILAVHVLALTVSVGTLMWFDLRLLGVEVAIAAGSRKSTAG